MKEIIIVLGGGLSKNGDLTNKVKKRVKLAYDLIDEADAIIFSSKYTLNIPQKTDINGFVLFEASAMAKYFLKLGPVSSCSIFTFFHTEFRWYFYQDVHPILVSKMRSTTA